MLPDLLEGWNSHQAGMFADAARIYQAILDRDPLRADVLNLYGILHLQNGYTERAEELFSKAVSINPGNPDYWTNLGEAQRRLGKNEDACSSCLQALDIKPDNPDASNNLALACHDLGRFDQAIEVAEKALKTATKNALLYNTLGTSLAKVHQEEKAIRAFRQAIETDPDLGVAHSNLGQLLAEQGQAEEGLHHCLEGVRLQPFLAGTHNNLGNIYRSLGKHAEARKSYEEAGRLEPANPLVLINLGLTWQMEGDASRAIGFFRSAVEVAPENPEMWLQLMNAQEANEDYQAALQSCEKVVALKQEDPVGYYRKGQLLRSLGRPLQAGRLFEETLRKDPDHLLATVALGQLGEEMGDFQQAEKWFRQALKFHPDHLYPLSQLALLLKKKLPEQERLQLVHKLQNNDSHGVNAYTVSRSQGLFAWASLQDAEGDYKGAAASLKEANSLELGRRRLLGQHYDASKQAGLVDRLIGCFSQSFFDRLDKSGSDSSQPVFVMGMPRSGTTLVEQILASHSAVYGAGELPFASLLFRSIPQLLSMNDEMKPCLEALQGQHIRQLADRYLELLAKEMAEQQAGSGAVYYRDKNIQRIVDKLPDNYLYLGLLAVMFPNARFIHVNRDPRDVALSCWMTNFRTIRWANDLDDLAGRIRDHQRLMAWWKQVLPVKIHEVEYEELVEHFPLEARRLVEACGLSWEPACERFYQNTRPVRTASVTQVRTPIYRQSLHRWKNYQPCLENLFEKINKPAQG